MNYFKNLETGDLIQYNPETEVFKIRNSIDRTDHRISSEEFNKFRLSGNIINLNKNKFSQAMNVWYKDIEHEWVFEGKNFKKLPNFESSDFRLSNNYILGKDVPYHEIEGKKWLGEVILVYHWGKVYYHTVSYNGDKQGQLIDTKNFQLVRWAQLKHCSPILNVDKNKIV